MNALIESIFRDFTVDGISVPVSFLHYDGSGKEYVVYSHTDTDNSLSGDDDIIGYAMYYDFDVYTHKNGAFHGNYTGILEGIQKRLKGHGFVQQLSRSSPDMYEYDTGYYHKTLCFAILKEV